MKLAAFCGMAGLFVQAALAKSIDVHCSFSQPRLAVDENNHTVVSIDNCENLKKTGEPETPYRRIRVILPDGAENVRLESVVSKTAAREGKHVIKPAQPMSFGGYEVKQWFENGEIYQSSSLYPKAEAEIIHIGSVGGVRIAEVFVYPVRLNPRESKLYASREISFSVVYEGGVFVAPKKTSWAARLAAAGAENPHMLQEGAGLSKKAKKNAVTGCKYYIITSGNLANSFQSLADWKTKKGIYTKIVTTSDIYAQYPGDDNQEKIRNFIIEKQQEGAEYILLGGDHSVIPGRYVFQGDLPVRPPEPGLDKPPCDLYYSDCDGTWDADGDGVYGERADDEVDLFPDIMVGRASVETASECAAFVNKALAYEKPDKLEHLQHMLIASTNERGEEAKADIIADYLPSSWTCTKLYETANQFTGQRFIQGLDKGCGYGHIIGHGEPDNIGFAGRMFIEDVENLSNSGMYPVMTAINCMIGSFDESDCIVEHFMYKANGGAAAFMANSRLGTPAAGGTFKLCDDFYRAIFEENTETLGEAYAYTKSENVANAKTDNEISYCLYQMNLFGDPSMLLWTATPGIMSVSATEPFSEASGVRVSVTDNGAGLGGALVSLMWAEDEVIEAVGYTDNDGVAYFDISKKAGFDSMWVTVSKQNYYPVERSLFYDEGTPVLAHKADGNAPMWGFRREGDSGVITARVASLSEQRVAIRIYAMNGRLMHGSRHMLAPGMKDISINPARAVNAGAACIIEIKTESKTTLLRGIM